MLRSKLTRRRKVSKMQPEHRERFADGTYIFQGTCGHNRTVAEQAAESLAKRYNYKVRLTVKRDRVGGEHGIVIKPQYLMWVKA